jgi:hypothetical protein
MLLGRRAFGSSGRKIHTHTHTEILGFRDVELALLEVGLETMVAKPFHDLPVVCLMVLLVLGEYEDLIYICMTEVVEQISQYPVDEPLEGSGRDHSSIQTAEPYT